MDNYSPRDFLAFYTGDTKIMANENPTYRLYRGTVWDPSTGTVLAHSDQITALNDAEARATLQAQALEEKPEGWETVDVLKATVSVFHVA